MIKLPKKKAAYLSLASTSLALLLAFGVKLSTEQTVAIMGVLEAGLVFVLGSATDLPEPPNADPTK